MNPIHEHPEYAGKITEINELNTALAKVRMRIAEIEAQMRARGPGEATGQDAKVAAALAWAGGAPVRRPQQEIESMAAECLALREQEDALRITVEARSRALEATVSALSQKATAEALPAHKAIAAKYVKKLQELDALLQEEAALVSGIERNGYSPQFRERVYSPLIGSLREVSSSPIWHQVHELSRYVR